MSRPTAQHLQNSREMRIRRRCLGPAHLDIDMRNQSRGSLSHPLQRLHDAEGRRGRSPSLAPRKDIALDLPNRFIESGEMEHSMVPEQVFGFRVDLTVHTQQGEGSEQLGFVVPC
ncbi:hypothetical protein HYALB_00011227 [Hymenoscyphus albidus]|uniref:Uncharacterized protein n=1 Tax=Hymenoscyphus albidus TaxID=595503 RepID=A0A9N9LBC0_9HELO|nr:hypothetical protein HYALB_00011227 [Hymenoscyphus albidus]